MPEHGVVFQEQVISDGPSGVTLTIWKAANGEGRIRLSGDFPFGNRDFQFDAGGRLVGRGTATGGSCPATLRVV